MLPTHVVKSLLRDLDTTSAGMLDGDGLVEEANKAEYWKCDEGAVTYGVPMDPAAGMKKGVISKPYNLQDQLAGGDGFGRFDRRTETSGIEVRGIDPIRQ